MTPLGSVCLTAQDNTASLSSGNCYYTYGVKLKSEIPLFLPDEGHGELASIELCTRPAAYFSQAIAGVELDHPSNSWYHFGRLGDGSRYARWDEVGEFLVSADGTQIYCRQFDAATAESFQVYLLGQALSYALVHRGFEPVHGTAVVVDGEAVIFLGASGFGKSTLAGSFVSAGYPILTDDVLIFRPTLHRGVLAYPGPHRIKLYPEDARRFFGKSIDGIRMNPFTEKLILPLDSTATCRLPVPVKCIYSLAPQDDAASPSLRIEPLPLRPGFLELVKHTYNYRVVDTHRLGRLHAQAARLANLLEVRRLFVPRNIGQLTSVREAILADLKTPNLREAAGCEN